MNVTIQIAWFITMWVGNKYIELQFVESLDFFAGFSYL